MYGVEQVKNELEVRILTDDRRDDADLRGAVLEPSTAPRGTASFSGPSTARS